LIFYVQNLLINRTHHALTEENVKETEVWWKGRPTLWSSTASSSNIFWLVN